jgi:hypothetical protein
VIKVIGFVFSVEAFGVLGVGCWVLDVGFRVYGSRSGSGLTELCEP